MFGSRSSVTAGVQTRFRVEFFMLHYQHSSEGGSREASQYVCVEDVTPVVNLLIFSAPWHHCLIQNDQAGCEKTLNPSTLLALTSMFPTSAEKPQTYEMFKNDT